jgi:hypothetical protein
MGMSGVLHKRTGIIGAATSFHGGASHTSNKKQLGCPSHPSNVGILTIKAKIFLPRSLFNAHDTMHPAAGKLALIGFQILQWLSKPATKIHP